MITGEGVGKRRGRGREEAGEKEGEDMWGCGESEEKGKHNVCWLIKRLPALAIQLNKSLTPVTCRADSSMSEKRVDLLKHVNICIISSPGRFFLTKVERLSRSSYSSSLNECTLFVPFRWTLKRFSVLPLIRKPELHRWGPTNEVYKDDITPSIIKSTYLVTNLSILLALYTGRLPVLCTFQVVILNPRYDSLFISSRGFLPVFYVLLIFLNSKYINW